jgi:hypothetical protein
MGSSPSTPETYDPYSVAAQQNTYNQQAFEDQAAIQAMNQATPYGSVAYQQVGTTPQGTPIYSSSTQFSPTEQNLFNLGAGVQQSLGFTGLNALSTIDQLAPQYSTAANLTSGANSLTNQMMGSELSSLEPTFNEQQEQLTAQLTAEGLGAPGSLPTTPGGPGAGNQAWANAENQLGMTQGQTMSQFLASAYPQAFSMAENQYELPLQNNLTMASLLQGVTGPQSPLTGTVSAPTATIQPTNLEGAIATAEQQEDAVYQAQMQQYSGELAGIAGLGGAGLTGLGLLGSGSGGGFLGAALLPVSDRRLKEGIKRIGTAHNGLPLYLFRYKGDKTPHIGVMADEVLGVVPDAVHVRNGYFVVDYDKAMGTLNG